MPLDSHYTSDLLEAGVDEVARGCLAGPVFAAAVIWPREIELETDFTMELKDSKKLSRNQRNNLREYIEAYAIDYSVASVNNQEIDSINIRNSFQDAIDFDFSMLTINKIDVSNAGNDCFDTSGGRYIVNKLNLNICKDKGISVGEKSFVKIDKALISNSNIAIVSKDSSEAILKNGYLKNNKFCLAVYNKKQEFGPSEISIPNNLCSKDKMLVQTLSSIK